MPPTVVIIVYIIMCLLILSMSSNPISYLIAIMLLGVFVFGMYYNAERGKRSRKGYIYTNTEYGVELKGYNVNGYIKNIGSEPIRIKSVWVFKGETTQYIKVFKPNEIRKQYISYQNSFYILDPKTGAEIGIVHVSESMFKKE